MLLCGLFVLGVALVVACVVFPFPCAHFVCCWSMHSSTIPLRAGTLLLFWSVHKPASLNSLVVRVVLLCVVDFLPTSRNSGAKSRGGFLRSEKSIFPFFFFFSASFCRFFFLFHWRARDQP